MVVQQGMDGTGEAVGIRKLSGLQCQGLYIGIKTD